MGGQRGRPGDRGRLGQHDHHEPVRRVESEQFYAVLGYVVDTPVLGVALNGADTSNFNIGGPGVTEPAFTRDYFAALSMKLGKPCIPVFNTANKGNTNVAVCDVAASTTVNVTLIVAIMPPLWRP